MTTATMNLIDEPTGDMANLTNVVCKFVLVRWKDCIFLVIGPVAQFPYHANLLEKFCDSNQLPCSWASRPTLLEVYDQALQVRGGGWAEVQPKLKKIIFKGRSTAYGKFVRDDLQAVLEQHHLCDGFLPQIVS